jgi:hypothetical protein
MYFSTYRKMAYVGMLVGPFILFGMFYAATHSLGDAAVLAIVLALVLTPLQFWQLSRLQSRLDDHDGSIPLGWAFDWDLEDDSKSGVWGFAPAPTSISGPAPTPTVSKSASAPAASTSAPAPAASPGASGFCDSCGRASFVQASLFCPYCGSALAPRR